MTTYKIKQTIEGIDYLEMTSPKGVISFVPMVAGNADYEAYLAAQYTPIVTEDE
jgi:hypothetical protein